jgi:site-specific DNA recombinase
VSTEEQAENPEGSIRNQEDRLRSAIQQRNLDGPFGEVAGVFIDRAKSGKDTNRSELQKLLTAIRKHEINLVMVSELSRLSRSIKDFSGIWEMMQENGCGFLSLREAFDTTTAAGEMVLYTVANIAQFERRQVSERVSANIQARAARGLYNGGCVPLGYKLIPEKRGYLEIDPAQAEIVKTVFKTYPLEGSLSLTAKWLNANGYRFERMTQGGGNKPRLGHFTIQNVEDILKNKAYIGVKNFQQRGETLEAKAVWEPIIARDYFERIQKQLTANKGRLKPDSFKTYPYLLSGLVTCGQCGGNMCGKSAHGSSCKVAYYEHSWLTKKNGCLIKKAFDCKPFRIQAKVLEPMVWEKVEEILSKPEIGRELIRDAQKRFENDEGTGELARIKLEFTT